VTLPLGNDRRNGKVYRFQRDSRGDPIGGAVISDANLIGDVHGIVWGGAAPQRVRGRQDVASTEGMIGCTGVTLKHGDRLVIAGQKYAVVGDPQYAYPNLFSQTDTGYQWVELESMIS